MTVAMAEENTLTTLVHRDGDEGRTPRHHTDDACEEEDRDEDE